MGLQRWGRFEHGVGGFGTMSLGRGGVILGFKAWDAAILHLFFLTLCVLVHTGGHNKEADHLIPI